MNFANMFLIRKRVNQKINYNNCFCFLLQHLIDASMQRFLQCDINVSVDSTFLFWLLGVSGFQDDIGFFENALKPSAFVLMLIRTKKEKFCIRKRYIKRPTIANNQLEQKTEKRKKTTIV